MSIFSSKSSKKVAEQEKLAARAEKAKSVQTPTKPKYVHVPTHAAFDALSSAPANWRTASRSSLPVQRQQSNVTINSTGTYKRAHSSFYGPPLPRSTSFNHYDQQQWPVKGGDMSWLGESQNQLPRSRTISYMGSRTPSSIGIPLESPASGDFISEDGEYSPPSSSTSASSISSQLEMARRKPRTIAKPENQMFERLNTATVARSVQAQKPVAVPAKPAALLPNPEQDAAVEVEAKKERKLRWMFKAKKAQAVPVAVA